jgi:iron complex outermembrane receptor protein
MKLKSQLMTIGCIALSTGIAYAEATKPVDSTKKTAESQRTIKPDSKTDATNINEYPIVLDTIIVRGQTENSDDPFGSALRAEDIIHSRTAFSDTAQMFRNTPGVSLSSGGGVSSRPVIHGMADDRLRLQVDGMNLISACANHMNPAFSYVVPSSVMSAQVLAGVTPVSMGGDSIGGTIRINSADPLFAEGKKNYLITGMGSVFFRSNGDARGGNISATAANKNVSLTYTGSTVEAHNYKAGGEVDHRNRADLPDTVARNVVGSTAYKVENQALSLALRNDQHLAVIKVGQQNIPYQNFPNVRMDMTGDDSWFANVFTKSKFDWGKLEMRYYYQDSQHAMNFNEDKGGLRGSNMPMNTHGINQGVSIKAAIDLTDKHTLTVGSEYQRYRLDDWWNPIGPVIPAIPAAPGRPAVAAQTGMRGDTPFWNINGGKRDRLDIFADWEGRWNNKWLTLVGLRIAGVEMNTGNVQEYGSRLPVEAVAFNDENRKKTNVNIDWTALAKYTFNDNQTYELGLSRKTRSPNLYERYAWSRGSMNMNMNNWFGDGNGYRGNINLHPEVAHTISTTLDWHDAERTDWQVKTTPFYTHVENYIDAGLCQPAYGMPCTSPSATGFNFLQLGNYNAQLYGVDVSGYKRLFENNSYGRFIGKAIMSYVRGENLTNNGNLYQQMPFNATVSIEHKLGGFINTIETQIVAPKTDVQTVRGEPKTAGYALLNLRSQYSWKYFRIDAGIENLLDQNYNLPLGGTYIGEQNILSGSPVHGMGRSYNVGLTVTY